MPIPLPLSTRTQAKFKHSSRHIFQNRNSLAMKQTVWRRVKTESGCSRPAQQRIPSRCSTPQHWLTVDRTQATNFQPWDLFLLNGTRSPSPSPTMTCLLPQAKVWALVQTRSIYPKYLPNEEDGIPTSRLCCTARSLASIWKKSKK